MTSYRHRPLDARLLVEFADPFDVADVAGILGNQKARVRALNFPVRFTILFGLLKSRDLTLG